MSDLKTVSKGRFLQLLDRDTWEFVDRFGTRGVVDIVAVTEDAKLILVEQYRPAADAPVIELPAGLIGDEKEQSNEDPAEAARRELLEETGYAAGQIDLVGHGMAAPGHSTETVFLFLATDLTQVSDGGGTEDENITVHAVPISNIHAWAAEQVGRGAVISLRIYAGLYFAQQYLSGEAVETL